MIRNNSIFNYLSSTNIYIINPEYVVQSEIIYENVYKLNIERNIKVQKK